MASKTAKFSIPVKVEQTFDIQTPVAIEICNQFLEWLDVRSVGLAFPGTLPSDLAAIANIADDIGFRELAEAFIEDWAETHGS